MVAPCMNCEERHEKCHSSCDRYKDWTRQLSVWKGKVITARAKDSVMKGYRQQVLTREIKNNRGKR